MSWLLRWISNFPKQQLQQLSALTFCAFFLATVPLATAYSDPLPQAIKFQRLLENNDIAIGEIRAITQDNQGFMWIGGSNGLIRYDGYEFKSIFLPPQDASHRNDQAKKQLMKNVDYIYEDSDHILWVGTTNGLFLYDPRKELVTTFEDDASSLPISTANVQKVMQIPSGELLASTESGLFVINRKNHHYSVIVADSTNKNGLHSSQVFVAYLDHSGALWIGTSAGLEKLDWATKKFTLFKPYPARPDLLEANQVIDIVADPDGSLWLGTKDGLVKFNPLTQQTIRYLNDPQDPHSFSGNPIESLMIDSHGALWVASDGGGIAVFEKTEEFPAGRFTNHQWQSDQATSLSTNVARVVYEDPTGDVWVGNYPSGINYFDRSSSALTTVFDEAKPRSLKQNPILAVREDSQHNLWLGTDGGGLLRLDRKNNQVTAYTTDPDNDKSLSDNAVLDIFIADDGKIWASTWAGGVSILDPATGKFHTMPFDRLRLETHSISTSKRLNNASVWSIKQDRQKNIWLTTTTGGLSKFDPNTNTYTHYVNVANEPDSLSHGIVWNTFEDSRGNFWVGTASSLDLMDRAKGTFTHFRADPKDPKSISNSSAKVFLEDTRHRLWVGTGAGLNLVNRDEKTFTVYNNSSGFNDDNIKTIVEDTEGQLWLSTQNGVSVFNPETNKIKNYTRDANRLMGIFHVDSGLLSSRGEVILGGVEGLRIFDPKKLKDNLVVPPIVFTGLKIFTDDVLVGNADGILSQSLNHTKSIVLDYKKSMFQLSFAALNFRGPQKNQYAYKLDGFDEKWLPVGGQRTAVYTNLDAGTYVFRVKGSNGDGIWNNEGASIIIVQLPPPWKTWWAYSLYALIFLLLLSAFVYSQKQKVNYERQVNLRLRNLDALKENFLANTSHELRTPLNGIIGLTESLCASETELSREAKQKLKMILNSGKRLSNIINDILEFSLLANNELVLKLSHIPLRRAVTRVLTDLQDSLGEKSLVISHNISDDIVVFSHEYRLSQILHHIIDNAIKFTRKGSVSITHRRSEGFDTISITDTGVGIAPENIETIFTAFQQVDGSAKRATEGAGLGLSVIKKLVELHQGKINVESIVGKGTTFHIMLPCSTAESHSNIQENTNNSLLAINTQSSQETKKVTFVEKKHQVHTICFNSHLYAEEFAVPIFINTEKKYKILIVDDDAINRMVVKAHLRKNHYETAEAVDGTEALKVIAEQKDIDLILLDIMMPKMTGYETCETLRKQNGLHALPILFLTANQQPNEVIKAFLVGGNDFLTKPVTAQKLGDKVKIHLALLEQTRQLDLSVVAKKSTFDIPAQHFLPLQQAVANIVEQAFYLIAPVEMIGCWIQNADNHFECIANVPLLPAVAPHKPLTWQEMEELTDIVGKENKNISLMKNLTDTARTGRLGKNFVNAWELYCELIFRDNFIVGFIIIAGSTSEFMMPEDHAILLQCQTHIAAAFTKMQKVQTLLS